MEKIKLFIADDEPMSIEYFKSFFYMNERYSIVGEAYDGKRAYEKIIKLKPDLIFADISMPVMDGLELADKLLKVDKTIQIILLTSYRDFDYAKRGLELGVASYLLKHQINQEILFGEIEKVIQKVMMQKQTDRKVLHHNLKKFLAFPGETEKETSFASYRKGEEFMILNIIWNKPLMQKKGLKYKVPVDWEDLDDYEAGFFRCRSIVEMEAGKYTALCFLKSGYSQRELRALVHDFSIKLQGTFNKHEDTATIIISNPTSNFYRLPCLYQKLMLYSERVYVFERNAILYQEELKINEKSDKMPDIMFELLGHLENEESKGIAYTKHVLSQVVFAGSLQEYEHVIRDILKVLEHFTRRNNIFFDFESEYQNLYTIHETEQWMISLEKKIFQVIGEYSKSNYPSPVKGALFYMKDNYEHNISVQDIADHCRLSESHLRKKFKQELGHNIVDYLTNLRIQKSKELLRNSNCRVVEVYKKVGFTSSQYFSSVFKKIEGLSPSEYQKGE